MKNKKFSIGIIGLGGVAQAHLQAFALIENLSVVSVCDIQAETATRVAGMVGAQAFTNYNELLMFGGFDLVMVLTPASTHRGIVEAVANAGFHVFCEKPLAVTLDDGKAMVAACKEANVKFFYGSCYRYLPAVKKAHELIQAGAIGEIQLMTEQVIGGQGLAGYQQLSPAHYPEGGPGGPGMGVVDHGIHLIDIFSWFSQSRIVNVQGQGQRSGAPATSEFMTMIFANGAMGHLLYNAATYSTVLPNEGMFSGGQGWQTDCSIAEPGVWEAEPGSISIYGTQGALRIFHYTNRLFLNDSNGLRQIAVTGRPAFGHFATQLEDCMEAVMTDQEPSVNGEDAVRALESLLEVYN